LLVAAARQRLEAGQEALDLGGLAARPVRMDDVADWTLPVSQPSPGRPPRTAAARTSAGSAGRVLATSSLLLWRVLTDACSRLGFDVLEDEAFRAMVLARIVEPASKADSRRVLAEIGAPAPGLRTVFRSLSRCRASDYRSQLAKACAARSASAQGMAGLVMYDCTTLHFETGDEDGTARAGLRGRARSG
jgi:hypothetical protein